MKTQVKAIIVTQGVIKASAEMPPLKDKSYVLCDGKPFCCEGQRCRSLVADEKLEQALEGYREKAVVVSNVDELLAILNHGQLYHFMENIVDGVYPVEDKGIMMEVKAVCPNNGDSFCDPCTCKSEAILSFQKQEQHVSDSFNPDKIDIEKIKAEIEKYGKVESVTVTEVGLVVKYKNLTQQEQAVQEKEPSEFNEINDELNRLFPFRVGFSAEHGRKTEEMRGAFLAGYEFKKLSDRDKFLIDGFKKAIESEKLKEGDYWRGVKDAYQTAIDFVNRKVKPKKP